MSTVPSFNAVLLICDSAFSYLTASVGHWEGHATYIGFPHKT